MSRLPSLHPASVRAAVWALRAMRSTRRSLMREGLEGVQVPPPPALPAGARRGVLAVVHRRPNACLARALVLQSWEAAHGFAADVVIGVHGPSEDFGAHAWLETMPDAPPGAFRELLRLPPPAGVTRR